MSISLSNPHAAQWNKDLMLKSQATLEKNPTAGLMSIFSDPYIHEHRKAQYDQLSYAASINLRVLDKLYDTLRREPEVKLLSAFPKNYSRRIQMATGSKPVKDTEQRETEITKGPREFRTKLDLAETARVVYPLSEEVTALLEQCPRGLLEDNKSIEAKDSRPQAPWTHSIWSLSRHIHVL